MRLSEEVQEVASAVMVLPLETVQRMGHCHTESEAIRVRFQAWLAFLVELGEYGAALADHFESPEAILRWYLKGAPHHLLIVEPAMEADGVGEVQSFGGKLAAA